MSIDCTFSHWIKQRRRALDLTQSELAARIGCSVSTLQKFEEGSRRPSKPMVELLATHLAIPDAEKHEFLLVARGMEAANAAVDGRTPEQATPQTQPLYTNLPAPLTPLIGRSRRSGRMTSSGTAISACTQKGGL